jgi:hypothetical protein
VAICIPQPLIICHRLSLICHLDLVHHSAAPGEESGGITLDVPPRQLSRKWLLSSPKLFAHTMKATGRSPFFPPVDPWSELGPEQRGRWLIRIALGAAAFGFLLWVAGVGIYGICQCRTWWLAAPFLVAVPFVLWLAWLVGSLCLWRKTLLIIRRVPIAELPRPPKTDDEEDDDPSGGPPDDAPRPAPLRPFSPRTLVARADLLFEKMESVTADGRNASQPAPGLTKKDCGPFRPATFTQP